MRLKEKHNFKKQQRKGKAKNVLAHKFGPYKTEWNRENKVRKN